MSINEIKQEIISKIDINWPTLYKIRYVYLMLGKYLSKDTDFFLSVDNKLDKLNLTFDEINDIYNSKEGRDNLVICYSAACILKDIYDSLGIKSKLIKSLNNKVEYEKDEQSMTINHYFLAVSDEKDTYFMSLASDLAYIQEGMQTKHFANYIPYTMNINNKEINVYEGKRINARVLTNEELYKIDKDIKYLENLFLDKKTKEYSLQYNNSYFQILKDDLKNNKLYYNILIEKSDIYNKLYNFSVNDHKISFENVTLEELSNEEKEAWINILCYNVTKKICSIFNTIPRSSIFAYNFSYDVWIKYISTLISGALKISNIAIDDNNDYNKFSKEIKKEYNFNQFDLDNPIDILDKTNALVNCIRTNNSKNFNVLLHKLCYHFLNKRLIFDENANRVDDYYIVNKFETLFPYIFSCNKDNIKTSFNKRGYGEQIVLVKEIIQLIFEELNKNNSYSENYDDRYSAALNKIQIHTIKNIYSLEYKIVFSIENDDPEKSDFYYIYDPKNNTFKVANILDYHEYIIASERLRNSISILNDDVNDIKKR